MADLPGGTVAFLFTDIVGSTALWEQSPTAMKTALARHDDLFDEAIEQCGGTNVRPRGEGDTRFAVFTGATAAAAAALLIHQFLAAEEWPTPRPIKVRIGIHIGEAQVRDHDYYGSAVNRCVRIRDLGHGGQILLSGAVAALVADDLPEGARLLDLGEHQLRDLTRPEHVFQVVSQNLPSDFPPLMSLDALSDRPLPLVTSFGTLRVGEPDRVLTTLLLTDIVGSTVHLAELGDRRWQMLLEDHLLIARRSLVRFRGREIKTTGDGLLAIFDGPARAIQCAESIRDTVSQLGLTIRAGLHTGEVEILDRDLAGIAVHIAARIVAEAGPGEVLVSSVVRELVAGSGIELEDRGPRTLRNVPGEWRLFRVARAT
jgi:class 3 adenylate cyclase